MLPTPHQPPSRDMISASKDAYNLNVIRRRHPSIISIFDQFHHVCLYNHEDGKWHKFNAEGPMFLCERNTYPPYALYVLNRMSMDDYVQGIYPEDEVYKFGKYVIIKSYPNYVAQRLAQLPPRETLDKFSPLYHVPNIDSISKEEKGPFVIKGLWMHTTNDRLMDTMTRLLSYVKLNQPYPESLKNPHTTPNSSSNSNYYSDSEGYQSDAKSTVSQGLSDVDKLFAKLAPPPPPTPPVSNVPPQSLRPASSSISLNTLFASVAPTPPPPAPAPPPSNKDTLLAAMFASASQTPQAESTPIYAPNPSTSPPQILNQNVLSTLLGIPARTPSAASSVSISAVSHPSSREGDNEDDGESSDSPNTMFSSREDDFRVAPSRARHDLLSSFGLAGPGRGTVHGDVTPRPPLDGVQRHESTSSDVTARHTSAAAHNVHAAPAHAHAHAKPRANRTLVPFEPDSELWPYSRGPPHESSSDADDSNEIVELSFEDTSLLSDPAAFDKVIKNQRVAPRSHLVNGNGNGHGNGLHHASEGHDDRKGGKKNKKNKKNDAREREAIERSWDVPPSPASTTGSSQADFHHSFHHHPSASASSSHYSFSPSQLEDAHPVPEMKTPTMTAKMTLSSSVNGHPNSNSSSNGVVASANGKGKGKATSAAATNGKSGVTVNGHSASVDSNTALGSILAAMEMQPYPIERMGKSDFVREVLTLINTDKAFVDTLYQQYMARLA